MELIMKPGLLKGRNIYGYEDIEIDLLSLTGTTMFKGFNHDQGTSNGSCKSSVFKMVFYTLTGDELDDSPVDSIIRDHSTGGLLLSLDVHDRNDLIKIVRFRSNKPLPGEDPTTKGTGCQMWINGELVASGAAANSAIRLRLQLNPKALLSSAITRQIPKHQFLFADEEGKYDILSQLRDLDAYGDAYKITGKELNEADRKCATLAERLSATESAIVDRNKNITELKFEQERETVRSTRTVNQKAAELTALSKEISEKQATLTHQVRLTSELAEIDSKLNKSAPDRNKLVEAIDKDTAGLLEQLNNIAKLQAELKHKESAFDLMIQEKSDSKKRVIAEKEKLAVKMSGKAILLEKLSSAHLSVRESKLKIKTLEKSSAIAGILKDGFHPGDHCPLCESAPSTLIDSTILNKIKESGSETLSTETTKLETLVSSLEDSKFLLREIELNIGQISQSIKKLSDQDFEANISAGIETLSRHVDKLAEEESLAKAKEDVINAKKTQLAELDKSNEQTHSMKLRKVTIEAELSICLTERAAIDRMLQQSVNLSIEIAAISEKENPYIKLLNASLAELETLEGSRTNINLTIQKLQKEVEILSFWKKGLSNAGVKSFICDQLLNELNSKTAQYMQSIFGGFLTLKFIPDTTDSNGVEKNKITTKFYKYGEEKPMTYFSGGQQEACSFAVNLAIGDMAESRSGCKFEFKFLDEPFKALDDAREETCYALLNQVAKTKNVYIISHNARAQNFCNNVVNVTMSGEVAKLAVERRKA
jgi:DNA repair exonuclease SbcCD ATPase subunit